MITESALVSALTTHWNLGGAQITVHNGGMGSATWFVSHRGEKWVAKAVSGDAASQFASGLRLARHLERAGIPAGAPVPTTDGQLTVTVATMRLALLTWVPGHPLTGGDRANRELIGMTLAHVHQALTDYRADEAGRFHWVDPGAPHLSLRPWIRPAVTGALAKLEAARPDTMTWGLLHADPAPDAFRLDPATGRCGMIDWSYYLHGPLLYDLASAAMYAGGPGHAHDLTEAYLRNGTLDPGEAEHGLNAMLRFRWAVQANYFAWRITTNNMTGITGPRDNEKGLEDARRFLSP